MNAILSNNTQTQINLENHWMPFTSNKDFKKNPRIVSQAKGVYYQDEKGRDIIDSSSGLFCVPLGHCRDEIIEAIANQAATLDFSPAFQLGQPLSFILAEKIASILPQNINHVFFSNSGSESVDTAMKMVMAYHRKNGEGERSIFVSRQRAYHGVNLGGVSLSGLVKNRDVFNALSIHVQHIRHTWSENELFVQGQPEQGANLADDLEQIASTLGGENIAAVFVEPIAGSTGYLVPPKGYLERLRTICDKYGIVLVFDEVITGFYRTGKAFAAQTFNIQPDIITMAKALTNGNVPMGATACSDKIYNTLMSDEGSAIEFFHGYTYSAHPLACAAGIASFDLMQKENVEQKITENGPYFLDKIYSLQELSCVKDIRGLGFGACIELFPKGAPGTLGLDTMKALFAAGLHVKFTGDNAIIAPPFIINRSQIDEIYEKFYSVLSKI